MDKDIDIIKLHDAIKSQNQRAIGAIVLELVASLSLTRKDQSSSRISSTTAAHSIFDKDRQSIDLICCIEGEFEHDRLYETQTVKLKMKDRSAGEIATRTYYCGVSGNTMHVESYLEVIPSFRRIGIGTALLASDDVVREAIAKLLGEITPITRVDAEIVDGTVGEDVGWTSRRLRQARGWR